MAVSYDKLWKLLIDKKMNKTELKEASGISFNVLARMGKNETISIESIEKICQALNCDIGDVMEFVKQTEKFPEKHFTTIELFAEPGDSKTSGPTFGNPGLFGGRFDGDSHPAGARRIDCNFGKEVDRWTSLNKSGPIFPFCSRP